MKIDHIVILVKDLAAAQADYTERGFTIVPGGQHAGGATHNALISLEDGTYLEIMAFRRDAPEHRWWRHTAYGEGLIEYALLPDNMNDDLAAARARGVNFGNPVEGGRLRPDGQEIKWQSARQPDDAPELPFLCYDLTPRELRVPQGDVTQHSNGAKGIAKLAITVQNLERSEALYRALLGTEPEIDDFFVTFKLGRAEIELRRPEPGSEVEQELAQRGSFLSTLSLNTAGGTTILLV
jgi:catechol 2,3-dioxygenase-like lactoylglutathione lyase family enzyme